MTGSEGEQSRGRASNRREAPSLIERGLIGAWQEIDEKLERMVSRLSILWRVTVKCEGS